MKKKSKKRLKVVGVISLVLIILLMVFYFATKQSILSSSGNDLPPLTETTTLNGYKAILEYPFKGQLVSGDSNPSGGDYSICGDNDGNIRLTNTISDLQFSSLISGSRNCRNYLNAQIDFPAGKLTGICKLTTNVGQSGEAEAICKVGNIEKKVKIQEYTCNGISDVGEYCCPQGSCSYSKEYPISILLEQPMTVSIKLSESSGEGGAKSDLTLNFEPLTAEEVIESQSKEVTSTECDENVDCVDTCGDKTPTCESAKCVCTQKTTFESSTQSSTQSSVTQEDKKATDYLYYLIPIVILVLVAVIIINFVRKRK